MAVPATGPLPSPALRRSIEPTTISKVIAFGEDRAAADLPAGTELTSDYHTICDNIRQNGHGF
jgi:hypothetical protein